MKKKLLFSLLFLILPFSAIAQKVEPLSCYILSSTITCGSESIVITGGTPGGDTNNIQYNNSGVFGGASGINVVNNQGGLFLGEDGYTVNGAGSGFVQFSQQGSVNGRYIFSTSVTDREAGTYYDAIGGFGFLPNYDGSGCRWC